MDRRLQIVALIVMLGCGESSVHPIAPGSSSPVTSVAPVTGHATYDVNWKTFNQCVPEWIQLAGTAKAVGHTTRTTDEWYQTSGSFTFVNVSGIGETTGDAYRITYHSHETINAIASAQTPYEDHLNQRLLLVRLSDGASWALKALWQVTVKPDGTLAVLVDESSISCT
jgi:hypothetical protein